MQSKHGTSSGVPQTQRDTFSVFHHLFCKRRAQAAQLCFIAVPCSVYSLKQYQLQAGSLHWSTALSRGLVTQWRRKSMSMPRGDVQARRQLSRRQFSPCTIWHPGTGLGLSDLVVSTSELLFDSLGSVWSTPPSLPSWDSQGETLRSLPTPTPMQSSSPSCAPLSWLSPGTS